uniref:Spindle pole body component n=1 Tax=Mycena chlorophos TaxID=658473 RepID=A0ABQ0LIF3_MYCCL|nr:predicted protein [Mycena chlorophos]
MGVVDRQIRGHSEKAHINSRDMLAEALETCYQQLKSQISKEKDLDGDIQTSRLPDHMRFLLSLASSSTPATDEFAENYMDAIKNPPLPPAPPTGKELVGVEAESSDSESSGPSLSSLGSDDLDYDESDEYSLQDDDPVPEVVPPLAPSPSRPPHTCEGQGRRFGSAIQRVAAERIGAFAALDFSYEKYIDEQDASTGVRVYRERGVRVTADMLMRVFVRTAELVWAMVGKWLKTRMGLGDRPGDKLEEDGLTVSIPGIDDGGPLDPDFWAEGYVLRDGVVRGEVQDEDHLTERNARAIPSPSFLEHVVLGSGKGRWAASCPWCSSYNRWAAPELALVGALRGSSRQLTSISVDTLSQLGLEAHCHIAEALLGRLLVEKCDLLRHLAALVDLYLMRRGDAMTNFTDVLFAKMDAQQAWNGFHFLDSAFRHVVEIGTSKTKPWIDTSLVRLSYRGPKGTGRSVKVTLWTGGRIRGAVPDRIRRAKALLERILVRGARVGSELKAFYAFRSRLSWFINTLLNFLTTQVIHAQVTKFQQTFVAAKSLDEMIQAHGEQYVLAQYTGALHRAIISVLDMALHFGELFTSAAGNTTVILHVSRQSIISRRHRSRRQPAQRKNVVSFSMQEFPDSDESSDEDEDEEIDLEDGDDGFGRVDKMSGELDGLVRFVRRGVESSAGAAGDAAASFSVFALEDWDL